MTQKKRSLGLLAILLMLTLTVMLAGCKAKTAEEPAAEEVPEQEEVAEEEEPAVEVVKVIDEIDTEDMVEPSVRRQRQGKRCIPCQIRKRRLQDYHLPHG